MNRNIQLFLVALIVFAGTLSSALVFSYFYGAGPREWLVLPIMVLTLFVLLYVGYKWLKRISLPNVSKINLPSSNSKLTSHPILEAVRQALAMLEANGGIPFKSRESLRNKIMLFGPGALRTILKFSRHEGDQYREDVYTLIAALSGDPIKTFMDHLDDDDEEIRWSCQKWIRDKGEGDTRPVEPLISFYARRGNYEGRYVDEALHGIGPEAFQIVTGMVLDPELPLELRIAAAENDCADHLTQDDSAKLNSIMNSDSTPQALKDAICGLLERPR